MGNNGNVRRRKKTTRNHKGRRLRKVIIEDSGEKENCFDKAMKRKMILVGAT